MSATATAAPAGALHVEHCMGTVFTIAIRDQGIWGDALAEVVAWLHHVDAVFSTYLAGSDISRIRRGDLTIGQAHPLVREVLDLCEQYEHETDGYFTTRLPGGLDPTGLVKGWAIERASHLLRRRGSRNHAVNGGGDMQLAGEAAPGRPWRVGIADPHDPTRLRTTTSGRDFAVATSGVAERGAHIVDPFVGQPPLGLSSITVVGPSLTRVDAYVTAAFAMGERAEAWLSTRLDHGSIIVMADGSRDCRRTGRLLE